MIISHAHRFAFIHNPKVAGTSVRSALGQYHDYHKTFWHQGMYNGRVHDLAHIPFTDLLDDDVDAVRKRGLFIFGFVRDPLERFWSAVHEFRRQHGDWSIARLPAEDLVCSVLNEGNIACDWRFVHFCPQWRFFPTHLSSGNGVTLPDDVKVFKHEDFRAAWAEITDYLNSLGTGIPAVIPLSNARHRADAKQEHLSTAAIDRLHRLYSIDFRLFGYTPWNFARVRNPNEDYNTHWKRVEAIHGGAAPLYIEPHLTLGESIAYKEKWQCAS